MASVPYRPPNSGFHTIQPPNAQNTAYLNYAPNHTGHPNSYTSCLEKLGFRITPVTQLKRDTLINRLKTHVDSSLYKFLRSTDNETAFKTMISEFLAENGDEFWGHTGREHLTEIDISKGFCYPRDALREGSKFLEALGNLFNYKARACAHVNGKNMSFGKLDYKAMTGRKVDALAVNSFGSMLKSTKRRASSEDFKQDSEQNGNEVSGKKEKESWNVFDPVETKTRLRPTPKLIPGWTRHIPEEDGPLILPKPKTGKRPRPSASNIPTNSNSPIRTSRPNSTLGIPAHDSDSDSEPIARKRRNPLYTPPTSHAPSTTPAVIHKSQVIDLENCDRDEYQRRASYPVRKAPEPKSEHTNPIMKAEPLSAEIISRTFLHVRADNMDRGPVRVPFTLCKTSDRLFTSLMSERKIRYELHDRVSDISATFTWNKQSIGIRKGRAEDWAFFCDSLRKAWEKESHRFAEGCNIDIMIHVDED